MPPKADRNVRAPTMNESDTELLASDTGPNLKALIAEFQAAGPQTEGAFGVSDAENVRRCIWPGQSSDGRKWDENQPEGEPARPWNGCSDTRPFIVDGVINDCVDLGMAAYRRAEIRATAINPDRVDGVGPLAAYAQWLVRTRHRRALELEAELALQYAGEYGWCVAHIGWEREISRRNVTVTLEELANLGEEWASLPGMIMDPTLDAETAPALQALYEFYVLQAMAEVKGFFEDEMEDPQWLELKTSAAKRYVQELREHGKVKVALPYICKNRARVYVARPYHEFVPGRGTMDIESMPVGFLRRTFTVAQLDAKQAEGWDPDWIEAAKKTAGQLSMWGGAGGQVSGAGTKVQGDTTWYAMPSLSEGDDRVEVVYAFRRCTDDAGVTEIYQTIFSPHIQHADDGTTELCAKHEALEEAHGEYPFEIYKRENLGRGACDSRSVSEIAGTTQAEQKTQRDMLFNRAQWDTLPPVSVPKLGGVDYRLGPGAQIPVRGNQEMKAIALNGTPPTLALEIIKLLGVQTAGYFGQFHAELPPALIASKQEKRAGDFFSFIGRVVLKMIALTVQYNPAELVRVTGDETLAQLEPHAVLDELDLGLAFDVMELDQEYLLKKLEIIVGKVLPIDVGGAVDRNALVTLAVRMLDSRLADKILLDKGAASQKVFDDTMAQTIKMAQGNEAQYVENDPTAPMKLQFLQQIMQNNPKYQEQLQSDERFRELMENYAKSLQMSVEQQENKQVGRIGVKQIGAGQGA